jgi:hypothetical protein
LDGKFSDRLLIQLSITQVNNLLDFSEDEATIFRVGEGRGEERRGTQLLPLPIPL